MAAPITTKDTFLDVDAGKIKQLRAINSNTGTANQIVATDSGGRININLLPTGLGVETIVLNTSEALAAGDFVTITEGSPATIRKAFAGATGPRPALGFVLNGYGSGVSATVYTISQRNNMVTGLNPGKDYYLSPNPGEEGKIVDTLPDAAPGSLVQYIGRADTDKAIVFSNVLTIERA